MISAQELRIGNLAMVKWAVVKITSINNTGIELRSKETYIAGPSIFSVEPRFKFCQLSGIPLTSEILEKYGFKFDGVIWTMDGMAFYLMPGNAGFYCSYVHKPIQYLHQLQNLFFALTGEELKPIEDATV